MTYGLSIKAAKLYLSLNGAKVFSKLHSIKNGLVFNTIPKRVWLRNISRKGVRLSANLISSKRYRQNEFFVDLFTKSNKKFSLATKNFYKKNTLLYNNFQLGISLCTVKRKF